ncbi:DHHA1 domain-containing protein, partial [Limosilactobacillus vaginalis]
SRGRGDVYKRQPAINGGGGGRPNLAQAGGKKPEGIQDALKQAADYLNN